MKTLETPFFAAIDHNGTVYGIGKTANDARADASEWLDNGLPSPANSGGLIGLEIVPCTANAYNDIDRNGYDRDIYVASVVMTVKEARDL